MDIAGDKLKFNNNIENKFEKYMEIMKSTGIGTVEWSEKTGLRFSRNLIEKFEFENCTLYEFDFNKYVHKEDLEEYSEFVEKLKAGNHFSQVSCRMKDCDGNYLWCKISVICDFDKDERFMFGVVQSVDNEVRLYQELKKKIEVDTITGIRNFKKFITDTQKLFDNNPDGKFAIIVMDIGRFKIVNDVYGIETGNDVLRQLSIILQRTIPENIIFARRYSDNFCISMQYSDESEIKYLIEKIKREIRLSKFIIEVSPLFGVYIIDDTNLNIEVMCDRAKLAKKNYSNDKDVEKKMFVFYDKDFRKKIIEEANIESEMYSALDNRQFFVYLQPKYNLKSRNIIGAEALVRWKKSKNCIMLPDKFLPVFEKNGFIIKLDEYIWEEACRILRKWIDLGFNPIPVSVNVSRRQIFNPSFLDMLLWLTKKYDIPHNLIGIELPESVFIDSRETVYEILEKVKSHGFILEMDDFGEGYSSLKLLQNVNVDIIKIDKCFLDETVSKKGRVVVKHTITMAKELNLDVIAEGVESKEQINFLSDAGCDTVQGFYFSKPLSIDEFEYKAFYSIKG